MEEANKKPCKRQDHVKEAEAVIPGGGGKTRKVFYCDNCGFEVMKLEKGAYEHTHDLIFARDLVK